MNGQSEKLSLLHRIEEFERLLAATTSAVRDIRTLFKSGRVSRRRILNMHQSLSAVIAADRHLRAEDNDQAHTSSSRGGEQLELTFPNPDDGSG